MSLLCCFQRSSDSLNQKEININKKNSIWYIEFFFIIVIKFDIKVKI